MTKPRHYLTLRNSKIEEVRHLLIVFVNGSAETQLVQLTDGIESIISIGTEYETTLHADNLAREWNEDEEFEYLSQGSFAFEPLERTIALAMKLGFTIVYDDRFKTTEWPNPNFTGAVPLSKWPGMTAKNGGSYVYALDQMRLYAQPKLPYSLEPPVVPTDDNGLATFLLKHKTALDAIGPFKPFVLGER